MHQSPNGPQIVAGLGATGSGINRLNGVAPRYPIFNWDDLPVKEGLHNRHMVGLTAWHTFFQTTHLTLHEKRVLVIGYGLVGQGTAAAARAYGGQVMVAEIDPARALQARYDGWQVVDLASAVAQADVIATATGAKNVLSAQHLQQAQDGVFILNVGHVAEEIDVGFLQGLPHHEPMPYVNAYQLNEKTVYLLANGSMFNLTAGYGDSPQRLRRDAGGDGGRHRPYRRRGGRGKRRGCTCCRSRPGSRRCNFSMRAFIPGRPRAASFFGRQNLSQIRPIIPVPSAEPSHIIR